jgi:hypothetical protein
MRPLSYIFVTSLAIFALAIIAITGFHFGSPFLINLFRFSQLATAFVGGIFTIVSAVIPMPNGGNTLPWLRRERLSWSLIGCGLIIWGIGEAIWRYYLSIQQSPFPSLADIGYAGLPPFVFAGLALQPFSHSSSKRIFKLLDNLIVIISILAIAWYLFLDYLASPSVFTSLGKFLQLYYPTTDVVLFICVIFLVLRGQSLIYRAKARHIGLLILGIGLCLFIASDFVLHLHQDGGAYQRITTTWIALGLPLSMLFIALAAFFRRFLPSISTMNDEYHNIEPIALGPVQFVPYILIAILLLLLVFNVLSSSPAQRASRPSILFSTLVMVGLVIARQLLTIRENERLALQRVDALERLDIANHRLEEQTRMISEQKAELEAGVTHLKEVQAQLSNGNLRARANLTKGELLPLAANFNLMAERLMRLEQVDNQLRRLTSALADLSEAFERYRAGGPLIIPSASTQPMEINRLLLALGFKKSLITRQLQPTSSPSQSSDPHRPLSRKPQAPLQPPPSTQDPVSETPYSQM